MVVVCANHIPPAVRGRMKLWFIETRPNVFVSGIKDSVADDVIRYLFRYCPHNSGLIIFQRTRTAPGYKIHCHGSYKHPLTDISGLQLIIEKKN